MFIFKVKNSQLSEVSKGMEEADAVHNGFEEVSAPMVALAMVGLL